MNEPHDDGGPLAFAPTDRVDAPWTASQVRAIAAWQTAGTRHPLTCETSEHGPLAVEAERLVCETCGYEQRWVPRMCAETYPGDHRPAFDVGALTKRMIDGAVGAVKATDPERRLTAERVAALVIAIQLMERYLDMVTPGGAGRDSLAWAVAIKRVETLKGLQADLQAKLPAEPG